MSETTVVHFHWADYLVFVISLCLAAAVGIFYGWRDRSKKNIETVVLAGKNMRPIPVAISVVVSYLSAISFLADPMEVYRYGIIYCFLIVGYCLSIPFVAHYFAPKFHRMKVISVHEYLEMRFNKHVRTMAPIMLIISNVTYMAVALLAPALALSQVTDLEVWLSIVLCGVVCTFYTSVGGLKAVIWADTLQFTLMMAGMLAVLIQGTIDVGGPAKVWQIAKEGGRINFNKIDPNPLQHATVWTYLIGGFFRTFNNLSSNQTNIQRYGSLPSVRDVRTAVYITLPLFFVFGAIFTLNGLVLYAYYHDCDPLLSGRITASDQMMPLITMDLLSHLPGVPGLFIACIFSASMSTLSTMQAAVASFCLKDLFMPLFERCTGHPISGALGNLFTKVTVLLLGIVAVGFAFLLLSLEDSSLFRIANIIGGAIGSPLSGMFYTGLFFSCVGSMDVVFGFLLSLGVGWWLGLGSMLHPSSDSGLSTSIEGCPHLNNSANSSLYGTRYMFTMNQHNNTDHDSQGFHVTDLYKFSSLLLGALGPLLTIVGSLLFTAAVYVFCRRRYRASADFELSGTEDAKESQSSSTMHSYVADHKPEQTTDVADEKF